MKKNLFLAVGLACSPVLFAQHNANGGPIREALNTSPTRKTVGSITQVTATAWDSLRPISELNLPGQSDSYPWISPDGLRIYFTQNPNTINEFFVADRPSRSHAFTNYRALALNVGNNVGAISCWLTNDELEIFMIAQKQDSVLGTSGSLYHASRPNDSASFSTPSRVNLSGNVSGFISGPSFSPDKSQLYLYNNNMLNEDRVLIFDQTANLKYQLADTLKLPVGINATPGQLSKDGKKFYLGVKDSHGLHLAVLERANVSLGFAPSTFQYLDTLNPPISTGLQPTVSGDENVLVFTSSPTSMWNDNELFIAQNKSYVHLLENPAASATEVILYPNPAQAHVTLQLQNVSTFSYKLMNSQGQTVIAASARSETTAIDVSGLPAGIYHIQVVGENFAQTKKLLVN